jgi:hypothetical protein
MSTPENDQAVERFQTACELFELGCAIMERNLRRQHGDLGPGAIQQLLARWLLDRPGAEPGDAPGRICLQTEQR